MAVNTTIDNYTVNADGQWTVNNIIQTKVVNASSDKGRSESSQNQSNSGIPDFNDLISGVTTSDFDMSDAQCGDSTGLPPMQSDGGTGGSSSSSSGSSNKGKTWDGNGVTGELGDEPLHLDPEWQQKFNEGIIRN